MQDNTSTVIKTTIGAQLPDDQRDALVDAVGDPQIIADGGVQTRSGGFGGRHSVREVEGGAIVRDHGIDKPGCRPVALVIEDRAALRDELARLGIGVGAIHQLDEVTRAEVESL